MLEIFFHDSGHLKYPKDETRYHYLYAVNSFDYPVLHGHADYWEFCIVTEGAVKNCVKGKGNTVCEAGTMHFMTTEDCHRLLKVSERIRYINVTVRASRIIFMLDAIAPDFRRRLLAGERYFRVSSSFILRIEELLHQCNLLGEGQNEKKDGLLCSAVLLILSELNRITVNADGQMSPFMKKLFSAREKKEFVRYTAADLQASLGYSSAHLNRLFREHFDMTPYEYLHRYKFRYARNLLQTTDMSIREIADMIGYSELSHFFGGFKKYYGITPGQCRVKSREQIGFDAVQD